jgi:hypothetical protein
MAARGASVGVTGALIAALMFSPAHAEGDRARANLSTAFFYTDNFFYENVDPTVARGLLLRPEFAFITQTSKLEVALRARGEAGIFSVPGEKDDYLDGSGTVAVGWTPTYRNRFSLDGGLQHGHDPWGIDRTEGAPSALAEVDEWKASRGGGRYRYGAPNARVNAELGINAFDKQYQTNRASTQFLDYQTLAVDYALSYNVTPKTSAVLGFTRTDIDFSMPFDNNLGPGGEDVETRSGDLYQVRTGARWLATAKTSGDVRFGYRQRTFDAVTDDLDGFDWSVGVEWSPTPPVLLQLRTSRDEQQSYRFDTGTIDQRTVNLKARMHLTTRSRLTLGADVIASDFYGATRSDDTRNFAIGLDYRALSWLYTLAEFGYSVRESTDPARDYDRLTLGLGLGFGRPTK